MLSELARLGARLIIQRAVEEEFDTWLGRARYERRRERERGLRHYDSGLRNGFRPRRVQTAEGELRIEVGWTPSLESISAGDGSLAAEFAPQGIGVYHGARTSSRGARDFVQDPNPSSPTAPWSSRAAAASTAAPAPFVSNIPAFSVLALKVHRYLA
ncbi:MAG: hypothetical protein ACRDRD_00415 [Pseudonocardiaceae bacterium]